MTSLASSGHSNAWLPDSDYADYGDGGDGAPRGVGAVKPAQVR
jgi:hypothetical protein